MSSFLYACGFTYYDAVQEFFGNELFAVKNATGTATSNLFEHQNSNSLAPCDKKVVHCYMCFILFQ
jgi:hypothetical protein